MTCRGIISRRHSLRLIAGAFALMPACAEKHKTNPNESAQLRAAYVAKLEQHGAEIEEVRTPGSLWVPSNTLGNIAADYKASHLNDTVVIQVSVQTAAAQSGAVDGSRAFSTSSGVNGILGQTPSVANPLFSAQSSSSLKGSGQTASNTSFTTNLTGQVVAVLPSGNLVLEAEREVFMNNQHEHLIVRGVIRPGDIGPSNIVSSTALSHLEIEMKGKGIIADNTRPPNVITRALLWLFNF